MASCIWRTATPARLQAHHLELRHLGVLTCLAEAGPLNQRALVDRLQMDKSSMVYIIDELERQGLAARCKDERDRRSYAVHLTQAGRDRLAVATTTTDDVMTELLTPFTPAERRQLHELLAPFIERAARGPDQNWCGSYSVKVTPKRSPSCRRACGSAKTASAP
ncbi:MarR family winged helix-turn-helix transcriptional regulator [Nocardia sp. NBC_01009]|uniref:MarR family winged helix-turn-helix transcriptional regulator n=1 Tax=Nocardia sp. NBC_01009 TaxID=2975996 RepID=UPI003867FA14|nr:MarR family transcriptional regulator [Nocardia sp. NBC_01009]